MQNTLVEQFKTFYADLANTDLGKLQSLYGADVVFKDPIHEIRGIVALEDYMAKMYENLDKVNFEYLDQLESENAAYIKWIMHFQHPKFGSRRVSVRGITQIQFSQRIFFQEDVYDMGAMIYENVPLLGGATRWLKQRLAS